MGDFGNPRFAFHFVRHCASHRLALKVLLVVVLALPAVGCVRRRLNVRTNPPGALVYVDNQQIGTTPCSVDFTYYGTREIRLVRPGYETLTVNQPIPTPWYEYIPLDFVSENLVPTKIRDNRTVTYDLAPQVIVPPQQLVDRGNQLRQDALQYPVSPAAQRCQSARRRSHPEHRSSHLAQAPLLPPVGVPQRLPDAYPIAPQPIMPGVTPELLPSPPPM